MGCLVRMGCLVIRCVYWGRTRSRIHGIWLMPGIRLIGCDGGRLWQKGMIPYTPTNFWELVDKPNGAKLVGCRWVLAKKYDADCNLTK